MLKGTIEGSVKLLRQIHEERTHKLYALTNWSRVRTNKPRFPSFGKVSPSLGSACIPLPVATYPELVHASGRWKPHTIPEGPVR